MQASGWLQFALYFVALALITKPMGLYLLQVLDANGKTWLDPVLRPLERLTYRLMGVDPSKEHDWKQYTLAMLLFSLVSCLFTYAILRLQNILPLNPQGLGRELARISSFNTASVSPPTPTGRATSAKPPCRISRRWSGWHFTISSRRNRHRHRRGARSGNCAPFGQHHRQFLGRSRPRHLLPAAADLRRLRGLSRVARHDSEFQALHQGQAWSEPMKIQVEKKNDQRRDDQGTLMTSR